MFRRTWKTTSTQTSRATESFLSQYQPGGTATVLCDNWVSRMLQKGEDPLGLGRWSYITLHGKGSKQITIITGYNACPSQGDTTFYQQQQRLLSKLQREHNQQAAPHPRRQFILDSQAWVEHLQAQGHDIILTLDANEPYNPDIPVMASPLSYQTGVPTLAKHHDGKLATLVASCGLKDPLALQHPSRPFPASHNHGTNRIIDYILISPVLMPAVLHSGSLSYHSLMHSDHRAYYLDLDSTILFADPAYEIAPMSSRHLCLQDPRVVQKYKEILHEQLAHHNIIERVESLLEASQNNTWTDTHTTAYQAIDGVITEAMLYAERAVGRRYSSKYQWSPTLKAMAQALRY
jgi:hypothetical protein